MLQLDVFTNHNTFKNMNFPLKWLFNIETTNCTCTNKLAFLQSFYITLQQGWLFRLN